MTSTTITANYRFSAETVEKINRLAESQKFTATKVVSKAIDAYYKNYVDENGLYAVPSNDIPGQLDIIQGQTLIATAPEDALTLVFSRKDLAEMKSELGCISPTAQTGIGSLILASALSGKDITVYPSGFTKTSKNGLEGQTK